MRLDNVPRARGVEKREISWIASVLRLFTEILLLISREKLRRAECRWQAEAVHSMKH